MKERGKVKRDNIFSPKNLLIGFIVLVILLLTFNYFFGFFSYKNFGFNQDSFLGNLYSSSGGDSDSDSEERICGGTTYGKCLNKCYKCVYPDLHNFVCVPDNEKDGDWCHPDPDDQSEIGVCFNGQCPDCGGCSPCKKCAVINGKKKCVPDKDQDGISCGSVWNERACVYGECI